MLEQLEINQEKDVNMFKMKRRSDNKRSLMKSLKDQDESVLNSVNEANLLAYLDCNEIIKCEEVYHYNNKFYIMLEDMDQGRITDILSTQNFQGSEVYSEDFCKYSLWKVAMGLLKLHRSNILHRDIRSDRIHCSADGQIKISDLGCFSIITEKNNKRSTPRSSPNWTAPEIA